MEWTPFASYLSIIYILPRNYIFFVFVFVFLFIRCLLLHSFSLSCCSVRCYLFAVHNFCCCTSIVARRSMRQWQCSSFEYTILLYGCVYAEWDRRANKCDKMRCVEVNKMPLFGCLLIYYMSLTRAPATACTRQTDKSMKNRFLINFLD